MRKKLVQLLNDLEQKYPVDQWTYNGKHVWPIIKLQIYFYYLHNFIEKGVQSKSQSKSRVKNVRQLFWSFVKVMRLFFRSKAKGKWIIATESENYKTTWNNRKINKFYYPLEASIKQENFKILYLNWSTIDKSLRKKNVLYMDQYYPLFRFWNRLKTYIKKPEVNFPGYQNMIDEIENEISLKSPFNKGKELKYLCHNIEQVFAFSNSIRMILKKYSPELILELCYYSLGNLSMNILANDRKIPVVELQHGSLGSLHLGYSGWSKLPKDGYNLFPKIIWCWDKLSHDSINTWAEKTPNVELLIGGNTWLTYISNNKSIDGNNFFNNKTIILYTMQREYIEDYIFETIKLSSEKYLWMLRPHPRHLHAAEKIKHKAAQYNIEHKIEIKKAQELPLPVILMNSFLHISEFSGSIIEAATLGTHSIILSQDGVDSYSEYIKEGKATTFLSHDPKKLYDLIDNFEANALRSERKLINYDLIIKQIIRTQTFETRL